jgi:hypothetical protein
MLCADFMPCSHDAALEQGERALYGIRVHVANGVDAILVFDSLVFREHSSFGDGSRIEDVNYKNGDPNTGKFRTVHGYGISAKRYSLLDGSKIIEAKGHGLGYLMSPAQADEADWMESAWEYALRFDQVLWRGSDPPWLDYPAMIKIPVSSPAVLGPIGSHFR